MGGLDKLDAAIRPKVFEDSCTAFAPLLIEWFPECVDKFQEIGGCKWVAAAIRRGCKRTRRAKDVCWDFQGASNWVGAFYVGLGGHPMGLRLNRKTGQMACYAQYVVRALYRTAYGIGPDEEDLTREQIAARIAHLGDIGR